MTKGLARTLGRAPGSSAAAPIRKSIFKMKALALLTTGTSGVGFGTVVIGDFPQGNLLFLGAVAYVKLTTADSDVIATFDGDFSIGTAATADATLSGSEVDLIPSTALGAATAGVSPNVRATHTAAVTGTVYDNTDGSLEANLNVLIDDASISGAGSFTVDGYVVLSYIVMGDD